jgi:hypothetical protein
MFNDLEDLNEFYSAALAAPERTKHTCPHCLGSGKYTGVRVHQEKEECFSCRGRGYFLQSPEARAKAKASRQARLDKKAADNRSAAVEQITAAVGEAGYQWFANAGSWSSFYGDLHSKALQYGSLSEKQLAAVVSGYAKQQVRDAERTAAKASREASAPVIELSRISELFDAALNSGLLKPALMIGALRLSLAPATGNNAGSIYVKDNGNYAGKITPAGKFLALREARAEIAAELQALAADPLAALSAHGHATGQCSCCGRPLSNPESVRLGICPICGGRWKVLRG